MDKCSRRPLVESKCKRSVYQHLMVDYSMWFFHPSQFPHCVLFLDYLAHHQPTWNKKQVIGLCIPIFMDWWLGDFQQYPRPPTKTWDRSGPRSLDLWSLKSKQVVGMRFHYRRPCFPDLSYRMTDAKFYLLTRTLVNETKKQTDFYRIQFRHQKGSIIYNNRIVQFSLNRFETDFRHYKYLNGTKLSQFDSNWKIKIF